ncbi:hypothetical protein A3L09_00425 [Thermococcus profundus]|uniref:Uncharacterized protein n=1 Tax=Thermococcus profundus TaxID=49899 RepID=A0A2Z2MHB2_THEPR|nr:hypothetical protein [Thermococcus profundus]ASJ01831.1 hypothetical protein A3L09_00425 [Thermococcus profundus]
MRMGLFKIFLISYALLSLVFVLTYSSSLEGVSREWEPVNLHIPDQCRAIGESIPLDTSGLYKVEFTPRGEVVTADGILKEPGEVHVVLRGVYFDYIGPIDKDVYVRIEPEIGQGTVVKFLLLGLVGGVAVASAFRGLGLE